VIGVTQRSLHDANRGISLGPAYERAPPFRDAGILLRVSPIGRVYERISVAGSEARISTPAFVLCHRADDGSLHGYIKDHIVPLACGGPDAVANLQWQTKAAAKAKDKW